MWPLANRTRALVGPTTGARLGVGRRLLLLIAGTAGFASGVAAVRLARFSFLLTGTACSAAASRERTRRRSRASAAFRIASKDFVKPNDPSHVVGEEGPPPPSGWTREPAGGLIPEIREIREEAREEA